MGIEKLRHDIQRDINPKIREQKNRRRKLNEERYIQRHLKREVQRKRRVILGTSLLVVGCIAMSAFVLGRFRSIYSVQAQITQLNGEIKVMSEKNEDLTIKISEGASLEKIEKIALEKLGMIYPRRDDSIVP